MEYDAPEAGKKAAFLIHLTDLRDFKAVGEGSLTVTFAPESGDPVTVRTDGPERPGIFRTEATFRQPGTYTMTAVIAGRTLSDTIIVEDIDVAGGKAGEGHHHEAHEEGGGGDITFLKEQQWAVEFGIGLPRKRTVFSSFIATGEIIPVANAEATVSAPLSGIISLSRPLPYAGKRVAGGETLAVVEPPVSRQGSMGELAASHAEAKNRVLLAEKEYGRAKRLYEAKAVQRRRVEEAELSLDSAKAAFMPLDLAMQEMQKGLSGNRVIVKSPFSGTVAEVLTSAGKAVEPGQALFRIINMSTVWLRANVPATEISALGNLEKATFSLAGVAGELKPTRLVTVSEVIDPKTRTVPVIFEVSNGSGKLRIGMFADVSIRTGSVDNALTVPDEALFEDEGRHFVFVQKDGESFERREVRVGIRGAGYAQVLSGIKGDERVVLKGGYYVKLASLSSRMPQGHGHDH